MLDTMDMIDIPDMLDMIGMPLMVDCSHNGDTASARIHWTKMYIALSMIGHPVQ